MTSDPATDTLIRFLIPEAQARGAVIRGSNIVREAARIHGLSGAPAALFGSVLLGSILLLSVSKGGIRQVLQLDSRQPVAPVSRILAEARRGAVRGYLGWNEESPMQRQAGEELSAWLGKPVHLATVRDLGFGHPYISTIEHDSDFIADHLVHYLAQSVQIHADVALRGDLALLIEAMPGSDEAAWFKAVDALARIGNEALDAESPEQIVERFSHLGARIVGRDDYSYRCSCSVEAMRGAAEAMSPDALRELADENGKIKLSCRYCDATYEMEAPQA